jgi:hypothetical protein
MTNAQTNEARPTVSFRFRNGTRYEMVEKCATFVIVILCAKSHHIVDCMRSFVSFGLLALSVGSVDLGV